MTKNRTSRAESAATLEHAVVPIGTILPNPRNPRRHLTVQLKGLAKSIRRFGQVREVLVRRKNRRIIAGHGVTEACKLAGKSTLNVVLWDVDQRTADAFMLGEHRLAWLGNHNEVVRLIRALGITDPEAIGFPKVVENFLVEVADAIQLAEIDKIPV